MSNQQGPQVGKRAERFRSTLRDSPASEGDERNQQQQQPQGADNPQKDCHVDPAAVSVSRIERSLRYTALVSSNASVVAMMKARDPSSAQLGAILKDASMIVSHLDLSTPRTPPNALTGSVADGSSHSFITSAPSSSMAPSPPSKHSTAKQPQGKIPRVSMPGMPSVMPTLPPAANTVRESSGGSSSNNAMTRSPGPRLNEALQLVAEAARALPVKAVSLLEAALLCDKDCVVAKAELGLCYLYGHGTNANVPKALQLFDSCMKSGHPGVMLTVGKCLRDGVGVPMDLSMAIQWMYRSANMGYLPAMHELGEIYEEGVSIKEVSPPRERTPPALGRPPVTAGGGDSSTLSEEEKDGRPTMQTIVLEKDLVQSYRWYKNAAEQGYAESQLNLAKLYMLGVAEGAEVKVEHWLKQAAKNGSLEAAGLLQRR